MIILLSLAKVLFAIDDDACTFSCSMVCLALQPIRAISNINEVLNTNLTADNSQAVIAGKGVGSNSGHTITYDCGAEHQVIICALS